MEELTGLVVCGGLSSRMGKDKSLIEWHGLAQRYFLYQIMEPLCKKVFISCNTTQANDIQPGYDFIVDNEKYNDIGPMAALLTALDKYPGNSFLIVGCDYPFIKGKDMLQLISNRTENDLAVSFYTETTGFYEPLLAIYENKIAKLLFENFEQQQYSLQRILKGSNTRKVTPSELKAIKSIDTAEDYFTALNG